MKIIQKIWIYVFIAALLLMGLIISFGNNKEMSPMENRYLQQRPAFSVGSLLDGSFQEKASAFLSDQFPARDNLMSTVTKIKKIEGLRDINGVYIGKDGYYFDKVLDKDIDFQNYSRNINIVKEFALANPQSKIYLMPIPSKENALRENLPAGGKTYNEEKLFGVAKDSGLNIIDIREILYKNKGTFFKTDHHWNATGAWYGYSQLCTQLGLEKIRKPIDERSSGFFGTLYSKTMDRDAKGDILDLVSVPKTKVLADGENINLYEKGALKEKDQYKVFLGGNYGYVEIRNKEASSRAKDKSILLVKDSFANILTPYLINNYEKIVLVDLRYYSGSISEAINENNVKDVVFLYELSGFANSKDLLKLKICM